VPFVSNSIVQQVIGCAIKVHREVGPGLFERVYQKCLAYELSRIGLRLDQQVPLKLVYQDVVIPCAYRADAVVEDLVLVEIKAVDRLIPAHRAQVLTYLRLSELRHGLLLNFNAPTLAEGLRSFVR
jgi:GxxExxY protein